MTYIDIINGIKEWEKTKNVFMIHNGQWVPVTKFLIKVSGQWREQLYDDYIWQGIDELPNSGNAEIIQSTKSTGELIQTVDLVF